MQLRIAGLRCELQRQRKALGREIDLRQKEGTQFLKKGKGNAHAKMYTWSNVALNTSTCFIAFAIQSVVMD